MDAYDTVITKLDVREYSSTKVSGSIKAKVLEAARMAQSGNNSQHWRFILVQDPQNLGTLARGSGWGKWVEGANFAIIVLTDPTLGFHMIDAGRAVQSMQFAAWSLGVASGVFTPASRDEIRRNFNIPNNLNPTIVVGFGFPARKLLGKKKRKPLSELVFLEKYGNAFSADKLS